METLPSLIFRYSRYVVLPSVCYFMISAVQIFVREMMEREVHYSHEAMGHTIVTKIR